MLHIVTSMKDLRILQVVSSNCYDQYLAKTVPPLALSAQIASKNSLHYTISLLVLKLLKSQAHSQ